jgi:hypothetical protein
MNLVLNVVWYAYFHVSDPRDFDGYGYSLSARFMGVLWLDQTHPEDS